jgi:hypothetical protein
MSILRTIKFTWKQMLGIAFLAFALALFVHQLYRGWAHHVVDMPWSGYRSDTVTLAGQPVLFAISAAVLVVFAIGTTVFLWLLIARLRSELRSFAARERRPPLDDAIREPLDRC